MPRQRTRAGEAGTVHAKQDPVTKKWEAQVRVRGYTGQLQRLRRYASTKKAAVDALQKAIDKHVGTVDLSADTPFAVVAENFRSEFRDKVDNLERSPSSLQVYNRTLANHVLPALGELTIHEAANAVRLNRVVQTCRRDKGVSVAKKVRALLNGIMTYAVTNGAIKTNPMRDVARIEGDGRKKKPRALTEQERVAWFAAIDANQKARGRDLPDVCRFLLATGCRIGEAVALVFDDVDFDAGTVDIKYTIIPVTGMGLQRVPTKTRSSERELHLPLWCVGMLRRRREGSKGVGPVFPAALTNSWRNPSGVQESIRELTTELAQASKDDPDAIDFSWVCTHTFRKTVATELFMLGMNARAVADQMGHSNISMTQDSYIGRSSTSVEHASLLEGLAPDGRKAV